jgi:hypothetical protein
MASLTAFGQRAKAVKLPDTMRYLNGGYCPKKIPDGRVLCHNPVKAYAVDQRHGDKGFRVFTFAAGKKPANFVKCHCGWSGLKHYAQRARP